jgi:hypothetical protein
MAFSDFILTGSQTTVFHSASPLNSNPLVVGGVYCRRLEYSPLGQNSKIYFSPTAYGGAFFNTPNTKVLSLRAHVRKQDYAGGIWIAAKDSATFASNSTNGYSFGIRDSQTVRLLGGTSQESIVSTAAYPAGFDFTPRWYSLRMDIFPLGALGDRIICYMEVASSGSTVSAPGSGIWNNVIGGFTFDTILSTGDSRFVPWSNNGRCGIQRDNGTGLETYVDNINFQAFSAP